MLGQPVRLFLHSMGMKYTFPFILLLTVYSSVAQQAGYRNLVLTDSSRLYKPGVRPGDRFYYRPVEIDCWYPATAAGAKPVYYGEFLRLFQERANRFQDDTVYSNLARETAEYLSAGLGIQDTASLTRFATESYPDASPIPRRFPLIVYMCSYNGMCFENTRLFELLARRGYIVAAITSVGRYPGNMTTDPADLREQVADGLFAIHWLRNSGTIDTGKIGLIGYSWGGPAALLLATEPHVAAILSLDGSELHPYGGSGEEDSNFNLLRPGLAVAGQRQFGYAYLGSGGEEVTNPADSMYNLFAILSGPRKYIRFPGASHEDFSCLPFLAASIRKTDSTKLPDYSGFAVSWFGNYLKGERNPLPRDSPYPAARSGQKVTTVTARVLDAEDKTPLAYVNVGIPGKNVGTVTGEDGRFTLGVDPILQKDSLALSMAGYRRRVIPVRSVPGIIVLDRRTGGLAQAVVTQSVRRKKILGNRTASKRISAGFPTRFPGAEMGVRIALGKLPRRLEKFHCHVSYTRVDSAVFRFNIFRMVNGKPENIMPQNILLSIGNSPGDYTIDLSRLNLVLSGDILVSLELLKTYSALPNPGAVFFSAALFNSGTWHRQTSQAEWTKARGIGVGFNLEVR
jgi:hypothetical protein